jgi:hypothetical protein
LKHGGKEEAEENGEEEKPVGRELTRIDTNRKNIMEGREKPAQSAGRMAHGDNRDPSLRSGF